MNITQSNSDDLNAVITIQLEGEDYAGEVKEEIKKHARKATLPGFRPGKVPFGLVKKMLGIGVVVEVVSKKIGQELQEYINKEELNLLGEPLPVEKRGEDYFDIDCKKDLEFAFQVGMAPSFELDMEISDAITKYEVKPTEETIEERIKEVQERFGEMENPDEVAEGDIVFGILEEIDDKGEKVEDGFTKSIPANPKRVEAPKLFERLIGKKNEDVIPFSFDEIEGGLETAKTVFLFSDEEVEAATGKSLQMRVGRISRTVTAELNEEIFRKVLGDDTEVLTEEAFREHISKEISTEYDQKAIHLFRGEIKKALEAKHEMAFPEDFLKKFLIESQENITEENIEEEFGKSTDGLKWNLIVEKIQKKFPDETKIEEGELEKSIRDSLGGSMGPNTQGDMMEQYVQYVMNNEQLARSYVFRLMDDKIFGVIEKSVVSEMKSVSPSEFEELTKVEEEA